MLIRALIVFLVILNLGVAAWWGFHTDPAPVAPEPLPLGVVRLQLASEVESDAVPAAEAGDEADASLRCFSFGPFDTDTAAVAQAALAPLVEYLAPRRQSEGEIRGWRVYLPSFDDADAAQAMVRKLTEAGVSDLFVIRDGIEANSVALGRYSTESAARRRIAALSEKGFSPRAAPIGTGAEQVWFDVATGPRFDPEHAGSAAEAPGFENRDCDDMQDEHAG